MYICLNKNEINMTTLNKIDEIRIKGLQLINQTITLKYNVDEGCEEDQEQLDINMKRLEGFKKWAAENNQSMYIKHYFGANNFGQSRQFIAFDFAQFFNS